jgi:hypothetical protein
MTNLEPRVGYPVHYVSYGTPKNEDGTQRFRSLCRAATVTEVPDVAVPEGLPAVGLMVANPTGLFFHPLADGGAEHDQSAANGGTWHYPGEGECRG